MRIAHLKIGLFLLFLAAPVGSVVLLGSVESFGREHPEFPKIEELARSKARIQLGDAVLERSAVMKSAVQLHDWIGYRVVGFVSTSMAISGKEGWLFYRPELHDGACLDLQMVADQLQRLRALIEMAQASGLDLRVSVSPNKSTIYPDYLHPYVRGYWRCHAKSVAGVRDLLKQHAPFVIDHAVPLLAERIRNPDVSLYYSADTHWTAYGGAIALRQLLTAIYPGLEIPAPRLSDGAATQKMDLAGTLQVPLEMPAGALAPLPSDILDQLNRNSADVHTLITYDSFYDRVSSQVLAAFPNAVVLRGERDANRVQSQIASADRLIVNFVERHLVATITDGVLDWRAIIPSAIVARNRQLAEQCGSFEAVDAHAIGSPADIDEDIGVIIAVRAVDRQHLPCVRISLIAAAPTTITVALPDAASGTFPPEHLIKFRIEAGEQRIGLVLPHSASGARIGLGVDDGGETAALSAIEVGEIIRPRLAVTDHGGNAGAVQP